MQLHYLEYFCAAVECRSLNRAARKLNVSPQALCAGVAALEKKLGYVLLERSPAGVKPTSNGEVVFQDALKFEEVVQKWHALASSGVDGNKVTVKLAASTTLMRWLIPKIVIDVKRQYPNIYFDLYDSFVEQVFHNAVDQHMMGLITCVNDRVESAYKVKLAQNNMSYEIGPEDGCAVVLNKAHSFASLPYLTISHLAELRLAFNPQREQYFVYRDICKYFSPTDIIHIPEQENLLRLIAMDASIAAVLPRSVLRSPGGWGENVCAKDVMDFPMPGKIWLVYPNKLKSSEKIVRDVIRGMLEQLNREEDTPLVP